MLRSVLLTWSELNTTESGYEVERRDESAPGNPFINVGNLPANTSSFNDVVETPGSYSWRIRAVRFAEFGPYSNVITLEVSVPLSAIVDLGASAQ